MERVNSTERNEVRRDTKSSEMGTLALPQTDRSEAQLLKKDQETRSRDHSSIRQLLPRDELSQEDLRTDAPFRHTDLSTFEMVYNNLSGVVPHGTPVIDKNRSGGASREELQAYLRDIRRSSFIDKNFIESYQEQFLSGFSKRDLNNDGELQPLEIVWGRPERSYEDKENDLAKRIPNPNNAERREIAELRAKTPRELLERIDRVNTRKDHRVERLLLEFIRDESPEAQRIVEELDRSKVRVVMALEDLDDAYAQVSRLERNKGGVDGLMVELSSTLESPYAPIFRNELLHVRVYSKLSREVGDGGGFPMSREESLIMHEKGASLDHEIASSVAQVTEPGEKITFRKFYERMVKSLNHPVNGKPEMYFALGYGFKVPHQESGAIPIRHLLLNHIDSTMSEREIRAFERFAEAIATPVREFRADKERKSFNTRVEEARLKLENLNPSLDPNFYYDTPER